MAWLVLLGSAVLEAVWATALGRSEGLTRPGETLVFLGATVASVAGLGWAMRTVPTGTAYAVWTGAGSVLTVAYAVATGAEPLTPPKAVFLAGIVGCVAGLKALSGREADAGPSADGVQPG